MFIFLLKEKYGNNVDSKDEYSIVSCYALTNGYGEVLNMTTGLSNNPSDIVPGENGGAVITPGGTKKCLY